jgi:SAM-dependent methyltransferase
MRPELRGLDYEFLRYIQVSSGEQRRIQGFYLPFFQGCNRVVDLGCGDGDFVALLSEQGIEALGVDLDPRCCSEAQARGVNVVCQDVFDYLRQAQESSLDGIFSAHLVEHLAYPQVISLLELSWRALREGGVIVLTTPNVRALYPHLESFYMHFGHVSFYHPRLLCFFMEHAGFTNPEIGENPQMAAPLWGELELRLRMPPPPEPLFSFARELPSDLPGVLGELVREAKMFLAKCLVLPYLDRLVAQGNARWMHFHHELCNATRDPLAELTTLLRNLDRPVECYVYVAKGSRAVDEGEA